MITSDDDESVSQKAQLIEIPLDSHSFSFESETIAFSSVYDLHNANVTCHCFIEEIDPSFAEFFYLDSRQGIILGKKDGTVVWREKIHEDIRDTKLLVLPDEQVKKIDFIRVPELSNLFNMLFVFGDQGTVMVYIKVSSALVELKQFDLLTPTIYQIEKIRDFVYMATFSTGKIVLLEFNKKLELKSIQLQGIYGIAHQLFCFRDDTLFEALLESSSSDTTMVQVKYKPSLISVTDNPEAIKLLIQESLDELATSESIIQSITHQEESLSSQLVSINKTLYALRNINRQRELDVNNSLETTGFELTVRPVMQSNAYESCSGNFNTTCYLRICIKASFFLELEQWDLNVYLMREGVGQQRIIPLAGFEPHYEMGIQRYLIWERDVQVDLSSLILPLEVSTELVMNHNESSMFHFPISKMILDDFHFAIPVTKDVNMTMKRRGLEEISNRLMQSYYQQRIRDRNNPMYSLYVLDHKKYTTRYETEAVFNEFKHSMVHVRYLVEENLSDEKYRSVLGSIFNEGRILKETQQILQNGAEEAVFSLCAYPGSLITVNLSKSSTKIIDFTIQCIFPPALFKAEATLLQRIQRCFTVHPIDIKKNDLRQLEDMVFHLQEKYRQLSTSQDDKSLWSELNKVVYQLYSIHQNEPIAHLSI
ncbi:MAG: hypothetical protein EXX96DRAFT_584275 [Benjaminiella poitrasii]|nr:MAG: hypothetical protein EXX96DRAFT_584275 [Benjaminiella poitrasii]